MKINRRSLARNHGKDIANERMLIVGDNIGKELRLTVVNADENTSYTVTFSKDEMIKIADMIERMKGTNPWE